MRNKAPTDITLPEQITELDIQNLPSDKGVFYFLNKSGKILFIGVEKNIRKGVTHQLNSAFVEAYPGILKEVAYIQSQVTGSELMALLLQMEELERYGPTYNKAKKHEKEVIGIYSNINQQGFKQVYIAPINESIQDDLIVGCSSEEAAKSIVKKIFFNNNLYALKERIDEQEQAVGNSYLKEVYNQQLDKALKTFYYPHPNFFLIDDGIDPGQYGVIWIENNMYKGLGYFNPNLYDERLDNLKKCIRPKEDSIKVHRLIRGWLNKNRKMRMIKY